MKWMVASDIHGSAKYCRELLDAYEREKADRLLLLGDLLYHGPRNDLPEEYAPKVVITMLNAKKKNILCLALPLASWGDSLLSRFIRHAANRLYAKTAFFIYTRQKPINLQSTDK